MSYLEELAEIINKLKPIVKEAVGEQPDFENIWAKVTADFISWLQKPYHSSISFLDLKIYLLRKIIIAFNSDSIKTNKAIVDFVVAGTQVGGSEFKTKNWRGAWVSHPIIDRSISNKWGIMLTLKDEKKKPFKYEYID
jgi:hypothetical protein